MANNLKKITANIALVRKNGDALNRLIHDTALMIFDHAAEHGDCTPALTLVKAMPASMRRTMLVLWFTSYSPIRVVEKNDKVGILKSTQKGYVPYDREAAEATPFYELAEQNPEKEYDFEALVKLVERLGKQIEKKIEGGKVPANDVESANAIVTKLQGLRFTRVKPVAEKQPAPAKKAA